MPADINSTFKAQISVNLKDKKWNEAMALEKAFTDDLKKYVKHTASNPGAYFQAKNFNFRVTSSAIGKKSAIGLNNRATYFLTPQIKDYDTVIDLLGALKDWHKVHDESVFGKRVNVTVTIDKLKTDLHLRGDKFEPNGAKLAMMKNTNGMLTLINALNRDINNRE